MNEEELKPNKATKTERIHIAITPQQKKWINKKKYSPTKIFEQALKKLGFKLK